MMAGSTYLAAFASFGAKATESVSSVAGYGQQAMNFASSAKEKFGEAEQKYHDIFNKFDKDGNGTINADDLKACVQEMGIGDAVPDSTIQEMTEKATEEHGGTISWDQLKDKIPLPL